MNNFFSGTSGSTREVESESKSSKKMRSSRPKSSPFMEMFQGTSESTKQHSSRRDSGSERLSMQAHPPPMVPPTIQNQRVSQWVYSPGTSGYSSTSGSISGSSLTWTRPRPDSPHPSRPEPIPVNSLTQGSSPSLYNHCPVHPHHGLRPESNPVHSSETRFARQSSSLSHTWPDVPYPSPSAPGEDYQDPKWRTREKVTVATSKLEGGPEMPEHRHRQRGAINEDYQDPEWKKHELLSFAICQSMGGPPLPERRPKGHGRR